jgi:hypothetical protein
VGYSLSITEDGLVLGTIVLTKFNGNDLQIDEPVLLSLISIAAGKAIPPSAIGYIRCAEKHHKLGNGLIRDMALALTGVPALQRTQMERLSYAEMFLHCGNTPLELLRLAGVEEILHDTNASTLYKHVSKFNPYHKPAGAPDGGQFTSAGGAGSDVNYPDDKVEESYLPEVAIISTVGGVVGQAIRGARALMSAIEEMTGAEESAIESPSWKLGSFKSEARWKNQMSERGWTDEQISDTIANGEQFSAPNMVNPSNTATRYVNHATGKYVVMDNVTKEVLQVSEVGFKPSKLPAQK